MRVTSMNPRVNLTLFLKKIWNMGRGQQSKEVMMLIAVTGIEENPSEDTRYHINSNQVQLFLDVKPLNLSTML